MAGAGDGDDAEVIALVFLVPLFCVPAGDNGDDVDDDDDGDELVDFSGMLRTVAKVMKALTNSKPAGIENAVRQPYWVTM